MSHAITKEAGLSEIVRDYAALDSLCLKDRPQYLPKVMRLPAEQRRPEAKVQFCDDLRA